MRFLIHDNDDWPAMQVANAAGTHIVVPQFHAIHGTVVEDTWGYLGWDRWWTRYHAAGGVHHAGETWPSEPLIRTSLEEDAAAILTDNVVLMDDAKTALLSLIGGWISLPEHETRRTYQMSDLALVRQLLQRCRDDLRALPPPGSRTAAQREQAFIRRGFLVIARVLLNGIWTPDADDFDETGATG